MYVAASVEMVEDYIASWGCTTKAQMAKVWPAAVTAVFAAADRCPPHVGDTIALRVPDYEPARRVIEAVGGPIVSTSVNRTHEPPETDVGRIDKEFGMEIDAIVVADPPIAYEASTLVDLMGDKPRVLRQGRYAWPTDAAKPSN